MTIMRDSSATNDEFFSPNKSISSSKKNFIPPAPSKPVISTPTAALESLSLTSISLATINEGLRFIRRLLTPLHTPRPTAEVPIAHFRKLHTEGALLDRISELLLDPKLRPVQHEAVLLICHIVSLSSECCHSVATHRHLSSRLIALLKDFTPATPTDPSPSSTSAPSSDPFSELHPQSNVFSTREKAAMALSAIAHLSHEARDNLLHCKVLDAIDSGLQQLQQLQLTGVKGSSTTHRYLTLLTVLSKRWQCDAVDNTSSTRDQNVNRRSSFHLLPLGFMPQVIALVKHLLAHHGDDSAVAASAVKVLGNLLQGGQHDRIAVMLEHAMVPLLAQCALHTCEDVAMFAVRTLGRLVTGDHEQAVVTALQGPVDLVPRLLAHTCPDVRRDAAWMACNMAAEFALMERMIENGSVTALCKCLESREEQYCVKHYAIRAVFNITSLPHALVLPCTPTLLDLGVHATLAHLLTDPATYALPNAPDFLAKVREPLTRIKRTGERHGTDWADRLATALRVAPEDLDAALTEFAPWTPATHAAYPARFKAVTRVLACALTLGDRAAAPVAPSGDEEGVVGVWTLPLDLLQVIVEKAAYPAATWLTILPPPSPAVEQGEERPRKKQRMDTPEEVAGPSVAQVTPPAPHVAVTVTAGLLLQGASDGETSEGEDHAPTPNPTVPNVDAAQMVGLQSAVLGAGGQPEPVEAAAAGAGGEQVQGMDWAT